MGDEVSVFVHTDGRQGIGLIGFQRVVTAPDNLVSPLVAAAAAVHPEHDERAVVLDFDQSSTGTKAHCLDKEPISDDPLDHCSRYDGSIVYESNPKDFDEDYHHVDYSLLFRRALATWTWDTPRETDAAVGASRP